MYEFLLYQMFGEMLNKTLSSSSDGKGKLKTKTIKERERTKLKDTHREKKERPYLLRIRDLTSGGFPKWNQ